MSERFDVLEEELLYLADKMIEEEEMKKFEKELDDLRKTTDLQEIKKKTEALKNVHTSNDQRARINRAAKYARDKITEQKTEQTEKKTQNEVKPETVELNQTQREDSSKMTGAEVKQQIESGKRDSKGVEQKKSKSFKTDEGYKEKRYLPREVKTLSLTGLEGGKLSSEEIAHPNCLTELKPSSRWTVLIDETGDFSSKNDSSTNPPDRIVGVFVPENVSLPERNSHAVTEDFSTIETIIQLLLNSRCGILGISVDAFKNNGGRASWLHAIELLLETAILLLPLDKENETFFEVRIEQRSEYSENSDCSMIVDHVMSKLCEVNRAFAKRLKIKCRIAPKDGLLSYPDAIAYLWNKRDYRNLLDYTCWEGACLISGTPNGISLDQALRLSASEKIIPDDWEKYLNNRDDDVSSGLNYWFLKKAQEDVRINVNLWFEYLGYTCKKSPIKEKEPFVVLKELNWLKDFMPESIKSFASSILAQTCLVVQQKYKQLFERMGKYDQFENEINSLANNLDKSIVRCLRKF